MINTFIEGELIPAVILWKNRDLLFVIDGSHRLSALIAWVQDDYGDGPRSRDFFNHIIPEEQLKVAERTRQAVEQEIGSYLSHPQPSFQPKLSRVLLCASFCRERRGVPFVEGWCRPKRYQSTTKSAELMAEDRSRRTPR